MDAVPNNENATYEVFPATDILGDSLARITTVVVTAEDTSVTVTYRVYFVRVSAEGVDATHFQAVKVYPVPASDYLILSRSAEGPEILTMRNITGRIVKTILSNERETRIDVRDLHPGIYFISTEGQTLKFIKR